MYHKFFKKKNHFFQSRLFREHRDESKQYTEKRELISCGRKEEKKKKKKEKEKTNKGWKKKR